MKYQGVRLILDNFRTVLGGFSVDIQDIVRSAILDDVDISKYIDVCRHNPYRLDQIRLGIKEGLNIAFFKIKNGNCLYAVRKANPVVRKLVEVKVQEENLTDDVVYLLLDWAKAGYNFANLDVVKIPRELYPAFERGMSLGLDMSIFNNYINLSSNYIGYCVQIMNCGKDVTPFLRCKYDEGVLNKLSVFSRIKDEDMWNKVVEYVKSDMVVDKVSLLISCAKNGIDISIISGDDWSCGDINCVLLAYREGLDYLELIKSKGNGKSVEAVYDRLFLNKSKKVSGRFVKRS